MDEKESMKRISDDGLRGVIDLCAKLGNIQKKQLAEEILAEREARKLLTSRQIAA